MFLVDDLLEVLRDEQLRKQQLAKLQEPRQGTDEPKDTIAFPHRLASRMQVAKQYYDYLRSCGWTEGERESLMARGVSSLQVCSGWRGEEVRAT